jgi:hypothetical protein
MAERGTVVWIRRIRSRHAAALVFVVVDSRDRADEPEAVRRRDVATFLGRA